ncbi:MAG: bifunctional DNA-formamidopyrimidine glycosylase/DNA-(apurinic or apyrimidinic site) lyase [Candidatus Saccharimonadales bacterium]
MPELPEVETVRLGLANLITGKIVRSVNFDWSKSFPNELVKVNKYLYKAKIVKVNRRGKVLIIGLSSGYSLLIHLKMTGQLVYRDKLEHFGAGHPSDSLIGRLPDKSTRVTVNFKDGSKLFFNDQRKFGWMKLVKTADISNIQFIRTLGPEPLDPDFTWQNLKQRLMLRPRTAVKTALIDQKIIAGVGNIYADESLWLAKIHPMTAIKDLSIPKIKLLHKSLIAVLTLAIEKGGSTDRNYVNAKGQKGSYINIAKVFRREGQACIRCTHKIQKIRVAGRGTHYCPYCQRRVIAKIVK